MAFEMNPEWLQRTKQRAKEWRAWARVAPDICVAAFFSPGFSEDLSSWKLTLSSSGILIQDIKISRAGNWQGEQRREERNVGAEFVAQVLKRADELDFWNLKVESNSSITDTPSLRLAIRHGEKSRVYAPESVGFHAYEGNESARRFIELWDLIHSHAPFPDN